MGKLLLYHESDDSREGNVVGQLSRHGVRLERWSLRSAANVSLISSQSALTLYEHEIKRVKEGFGYRFADYVSISSKQAREISLRDRHLSEHTHEQDEVKFFLAGEVLLFVHVDGRVHALHCVAGDFLLIPKGVPHWMDMGPEPCYQCIRWYNEEQHLQNNLTGSYIAESSPRWEALLGVRSADPA